MCVRLYSSNQVRKASLAPGNDKNCLLTVFAFGERSHICSLLSVIQNIGNVNILLSNKTSKEKTKKSSNRKTSTTTDKGHRGHRNYLSDCAWIQWMHGKTKPKLLEKFRTTKHKKWSPDFFCYKYNRPILHLCQKLTRRRNSHVT